MDIRANIEKTIKIFHQERENSYQLCNVELDTTKIRIIIEQWTDQLLNQIIKIKVEDVIRDVKQKSKTKI